MTRIHPDPQKEWDFAVHQHNSLYRKNDWLVESDAVMPGLAISDDGKTMNIDICIPGVTKDRIEVMGHKPYIKQSTIVPPRKELIHIALPK